MKIQAEDEAARAMDWLAQLREEGGTEPSSDADGKPAADAAPPADAVPPVPGPRAAAEPKPTERLAAEPKPAEQQPADSITVPRGGAAPARPRSVGKRSCVCTGASTRAPARTRAG